MSDAQKTKWVHAQEFKLNAEQGGQLRVSEKGAIEVALFNQDGSRHIMFFLTDKTAKRLVESCMVNIPGLEELLASDTYAAILDNKVVIKEQTRLERRKAQEAQKLALQIQSATEALERLGFAKRG